MIYLFSLGRGIYGAIYCAPINVGEGCTCRSRKGPLRQLPKKPDRLLRRTKAIQRRSYYFSASLCIAGNTLACRSRYSFIARRTISDLERYSAAARRSNVSPQDLGTLTATKTDNSLFITNIQYSNTISLSIKINEKIT